MEIIKFGNNCNFSKRYYYRIEWFLFNFHFNKKNVFIYVENSENNYQLTKSYKINA